MLAKSCPKVSVQSRLSRESYDAKFDMDESARDDYGVTLTALLSSRPQFQIHVVSSKAYQAMFVWSRHVFNFLK